jgi:thiol-disulfide isomerase/thioredoxin
MDASSNRPKYPRIWTNPNPNAIASPFSLPMIRLRGNVPDENSQAHFSYLPSSGKVTILHFWASWCNVCRDEAETVQQLARDLKSHPVSFLGIATEDSASEVLLSKTTEKFSFPILLDEEGDTADLFQVEALPTTLVIDEKSRVRLRVDGPLDQEDVESFSKAVAELTSPDKS